VTVPPGVLVVGAGNLPSAMPSAASAAYARNVLAVLDHLLPADRDEIDLGDEIADAIVVATGGQVRPGHLPAATKGSAA
jgi:NAD(P) transhydrogenase subunit alpha